MYWLHISSKVLLVFPSLELGINCDLWDLLEGPTESYTWDKSQFYFERVDKHSIQNKKKLWQEVIHALPLCIAIPFVVLYELILPISIFMPWWRSWVFSSVLGLESHLSRHLLDFYYTKVSTYSHVRISRIQEIIFLLCSQMDETGSLHE